MKTLGRAKRDWNDAGSLSAFALSAITGAGKTVIATAVIEAMIHGSADLGSEPDPRATFLWVTDDPALNRQTRNKMIAASDLLEPTKLIILDNDFTDHELRPGHVYFLNIQKLSKAGGLGRGGVDKRQHSMWDVIAHTVARKDVDLYLVLDEAHRGMKVSADRSTIVQRIIGGQPDSNPPAPICWGISATIERFATAMAGARDRTTYPPVTIDIDKVRASGIIKDQIDLDEPDEKATLSATLLRQAVEAILDYEKRWTAYAKAENEPVVVPVLVIQVDDKPSEARLREIVSTVEREWPDLAPEAVVNVFGEHTDLKLNNRRIRYINPESIQDESAVRVVLAKQAISTGWDCPRAEVFYSERAAKDATHIAQLIGRMVRSPLARRIATDDALNSVSCFLPRFNRRALKTITTELTQPGEPGGATEITINGELFQRNPKLGAIVFATVESLPSYPPPNALANPLRRAKGLAQLLTDDSAPGGALMDDAGERLTAVLNARLDGLAAEHAADVKANARRLETAVIHRTTVNVAGETLSTGTRESPAALQDVETDTQKIVSAIKEGVGKDYVKHRVSTSGADATKARTHVAGLLLIEGVSAEIDHTATKWVQDNLTRFAVDIKNTTGATRDAYLKVQEQTSLPEETPIELTTSLKAATKDSGTTDAADLPLFDGHLYTDAKGKFPAKLNDWEADVIKTEIKRPSFVAWYRNPSRPIPSSLRIAYLDDAGTWGSLQIDFLVVSQRDDGSLGISVIDPHGDHLADAKAKLRGLANYAEKFGKRYVRIESIARVKEGRLRSLDLLDPKVRTAIREFEGGKLTPLYESNVASDYK